MLSLEEADIASLVLMLIAWGPAWHYEGVDAGNTSLRDFSLSCVPARLESLIAAGRLNVEACNVEDALKHEFLSRPLVRVAKK